jgi:hypothetical protein
MQVNITTINNGDVTTLELRVKNNFGTNLVYPVCKKSCMLANLAGKKTFSVGNLVLISMMGFRISFINIPADKIEPFNKNNFGKFYQFLEDWNK